MRNAKPWLLFAALNAFSAAALQGQAVQAVRGLSDADLHAQIDEAVKALAAQEAQYQALASSRAVSAEQRPVMAAAAQQAAQVLALKDDPGRFRLALLAYDSAQSVRYAQATLDQAAADRVVGVRAAEAKMVAAMAVRAATPVPGISIIAPNVIFTVAAGITAGPAAPLYDAGAFTNLLGTAAGAVFGAIGSPALQEYFNNNISVGPAFPFGGSHKLTTELGLGLGGVHLGHVSTRDLSLWPVLGLQAADTGDARVPAEIRGHKLDAGTWSSPTFSVAVLLYSAKELKDKLAVGDFVFVPSIGVRLPFYYAGDTFNALAGAFTGNRSGFVRGGSSALLFSIAVPLAKIEAPKPSKP